MRSAWRTAWAASLWLLPAPLQAEVSHPSWDEAFRTAAAPATLYYRAVYLDGFGKPHELRVWREADRRLRRSTDRRLDLMVARNGDEYEYRLVDHARRTVIRTDRTMLYGIGIFSDWRGLAHVLDRPRGTYTLRAEPGLESIPQGACDWYRLETGSPPQVSRICWSTEWGVPLAIEAPDRKGEWSRRFTVEEVHTFRPDARIFAVPQDGYVQVDADPGSDPAD